MPLSHYCTEHSGFWQKRPSPPESCPVCEDYRHPLPPDGYEFLTPGEVDDHVSVDWTEVLPGITMFWTEPQIGVGSRGFLVEHPNGNIAFEGATWYDDAALDHIESLGGIQYLSASHAHVYGALWRLSERFSPETVIQEAELPYAQAFPVTWPFDGRAELTAGATLHHTGGHTPGHAVLHLEDRRLLFCGDALKYTLDEYPVGDAVSISTHRAYDAHIPLTHADIRQYRDLMEPLDFDAVITPWEVVPSGGKDAALHLFAEQLSGRPFADPLPLRETVEEADAAPDRAEGSHTADPARAYQEAMPPGETFAFPITDLDRTDIPVWTVAHFPEERPGMNTSAGYGSTDASARIGAWGELYEKASSRQAVPELPRRTASYEDLAAAGEPALDPRRLRLPVGTTYAHDQPLVWAQARRYPSHDPVWIPIEEAAAYFGDLDGISPAREDGWLYTPITNGLGAGDSFERALGHGLMELVQRDGNSVTYRALDQGVGVSVDSVADPDIRRLLDQFDAAGVEPIIKLADTAFGMANFYVVGHERNLEDAPHPLMITGCGEGVHPDREVALAKALREYASSRVRKRFNHGMLDDIRQVFPDGYEEHVRQQSPANEESRSFQALKEWSDLSVEALHDRIDFSLRVDETVRLSSLPTVAPGTLQSPEALLDLVAGRFLDAGLDIFYVDYSPEGGPAHAVKAIVPPLEVETATYDRIGRRNIRRLVRRGSNIAGLGEPPSGAQCVPLPPADEEALGDQAWFHPGRMREAVDGLYAMYREPKRHVLALEAERS
ncbi:YcaO-like protein with predicted kinase domain [Salinibacter ruber]|uniref:YcaO-like family protein n=1 Tax=Salinibacter ruber TaxID=146919 RepID=UPI00216977D0|nr:YcaO-like family protein [Salinibacter ruber]MCS3633999.1 YcaO-like protein with predicted kinase domain [Salinibacter ruber]MCS3712226.1 YcaO-like protein with predicted kinase domain [Salinibacter ruber]